MVFLLPGFKFKFEFGLIILSKIYIELFRVLKSLNTSFVNFGSLLFVQIPLLLSNEQFTKNIANVKTKRFFIFKFLKLVYFFIPIAISFHKESLDIISSNNLSDSDNFDNFLKNKAFFSFTK